jgi:uncharacterized membrane protein
MPSEPEAQPAQAARLAARPVESSLPFVDYEGTPLTRQEYISAIVHLYRGEAYRATVQRTRLDMTTNWAVLTTAGLLAFSFREGSSPHWAILLGFLLVSLFMVFEARRYQMFDLWRARVRKIEENFYGPILRRNPVSPQREWGARVASDLFQPSYKIGFLGAVRVRLLRNYWGIYFVLLMAWVLKVLMYPLPAHNWGDVQQHIGFGMVSWWIPLFYLAVVLVVLLSVAIFVPPTPPADDPNEEFWGYRSKDADGRKLDV